MINSSDKLVAIVGPTASGKTDLALRLAEQLDGEIICADSRTIYQGMDIGTAKPTLEERARVSHHMLDIVRPNESFNAQDFKTRADQVIVQIRARGNVPFLVGGTGLYAYAVLYDFQFPAGAPTALRAELQSLSLPVLVERLQQVDPERATEIDLKNARRVIRALETVGQVRDRIMVLPPNYLLLGLRLPEEVLNNKIAQRTHGMFQIGLVAEVKRLIEEYGLDLEVLRSPGYAEVAAYLDGHSSLEEAESLVELHTRQLVKRQLTWFRRNSEIRWFEDPDRAFEEAMKFLSRA